MCTCVLTAEKDVVGVQRKQQHKMSSPATPVNTTESSSTMLSQARKHVVFLFETNCYKKVSYRKQIVRQQSCHQKFGACRLDPVTILPHTEFDHHAKFACSFLSCVRACKNFQKLGDAWTQPPNFGARMTPRNTSLPSVTTEILSF